jgi:hypothetical protein
MFVQSRKQSDGKENVSPYASLLSNRSVGALSYGQVDGEALRSCLVSVVERGDAVLFGRTSDGGALSVRVLSHGQTYAFYATDASELLELLEGLTRGARA